MSGFSADWLALREPADHAARSAALMKRLTDRLAAREVVEVVDLGCGTGSNLRATAPALPRRQRWTLVDHDPGLLDAARRTLAAWADTARDDADALVLAKGDRSITVRFRQADLVADLDAVLGGKPDVVTASALFDLCSQSFIERMVAAVAARRAIFFTVLTYDGRHAWTPAHPADAAMHAAFDAHQATDKGFGPAAGPKAPSLITEAFRHCGYGVEEGDSPWRLDGASPGCRALIDALAPGFAQAVAETGRVPAETVAAWRAHRRTGCLVGHTDTLAFPL